LIRAILALLLLPVAAAAQTPSTQSPDEALRRMGEVMSGANYRGVVVYAREGQLDALRVEHHGQGEGREELIERLTGPAMPLARNSWGARLGDGPHYRSDLVAPAQPGVPPAAGYELQWVGEDRVAGRATDVLEARARDSLRFSRRFWLEREHGLLLRSAVYGSDGIMVEQWMFADLELHAGNAAGIDGEAGVARFRGARSGDIADTRLTVLDPPSGFQLVSAAVEASREQLVFSDGLVRVSVFAEPLDEQAAILSGHQRRGALSIFGRVFEGLQIVVVGEVPASTAERFAQSLGRSGGG